MNWSTAQRHITGLYALGCCLRNNYKSLTAAWPTKNRSRRCAPLPQAQVPQAQVCDFSPAHLGRGSMLRIALLPAPNIRDNRTGKRHIA
jgi:hypothetical protein